MTEDTVRLDRWLRRRYPSLPQGILEKALREKKILVNGNRAKSGDRVSDRDAVEVRADFSAYTQSLKPDRAHTQPGSTDDRLALLKGMIIHEDGELCILNKPAGVAVQGGTGIGLHIDGLLADYGREQGVTYRLTHRLDRDTSGILAVAKTLTAAQRLSEAFRRRDTKKVYWALVEGRPPQPEGVCSEAVGKAWDGDQREKMSVHAEDAKEALTRYKVLGSHGNVMSWMELRPETGRTHQLRVHMSRLGCPIWGDVKYGAHHKAPLMLHARSLTFTLPDQGALTFTAPPSDHMNRFLEKHFRKTPENFREYRS